MPTDYDEIAKAALKPKRSADTVSDYDAVAKAAVSPRQSTASSAALAGASAALGNPLAASMVASTLLKGSGGTAQKSKAKYYDINNIYKLSQLTPAEVARHNAEPAALLNDPETARMEWELRKGPPPQKRAEIDRQAWIKQYGYDPEKYPARYQEDLSRLNEERIAEAVHPVTRFIDNFLNTILPGVVSLQEGDTADPNYQEKPGTVAHLVAGVANIPGDVMGDAMVLGHPNASLRDRIGAIANIAVKTIAPEELLAKGSGPVITTIRTLRAGGVKERQLADAIAETMRSGVSQEAIDNAIRAQARGVAADVERAGQTARVANPVKESPQLQTFAHDGKPLHVEDLSDAQLANAQLRAKNRLAAHDTAHASGEGKVSPGLYQATAHDVDALEAEMSKRGIKPEPPVEPGPAIWRNKDTDMPVELTGKTAWHKDGKVYAETKGGTWVPKEELVVEKPVGPVGETVTTKPVTTGLRHIPSDDPRIDPFSDTYDDRLARAAYEEVMGGKPELDANGEMLPREGVSLRNALDRIQHAESYTPPENMDFIQEARKRLSSSRVDRNNPNTYYPMYQRNGKWQAGPNPVAIFNMEGLPAPLQRAIIEHARTMNSDVAYATKGAIAHWKNEGGKFPGGMLQGSELIEKEVGYDLGNSDFLNRAIVTRQAAADYLRNAVGAAKAYEKEALAQKLGISQAELDAAVEYYVGKGSSNVHGVGEPIPDVRANDTGGARSESGKPTVREANATHPGNQQEVISGEPKRTPGVGPEAETSSRNRVRRSEAKPNATGLANQVLDRKTLEGVIDEVEKTKGQSAEHWQTVGKKAVEGGADPEALAKRIASGEEELTGEKVGVLLEGQRRLENAVNAAASGPEYIAARERLHSYLTDVQQGKGRWSDVGRALQAGSDLDTGNFAKVIQEIERRGGKVNAKQEAEIKRLTEAHADVNAKLAEAEAKLAQATKENEARAAAANGDAVVTQVAKGRGTVGRRSKAVIKQERDEILKALGQLTNKVSANPIPEVIEGVKLLGKLAVNLIEDGATTLAEVADRIREHGIDVTDQEVYKALTYKETRAATKTEAQVRIRDLKKQADLLLKINQVIGGETPKPGIRPPRPSDIVAGLQQSLADVKKITGTPTVRSQAKQLEKAIEDVLEELRTGEKPTKEVSPTILDAESTTLKAKLGGLREQLKEFRLENEIKDLEEQLRTGNFPAQSKPQRAISAKIEDLRAQKEILRRQVMARVADASKPAWEKSVREGSGLLRGLILGTDFGVLTRQGLFTLASHPVVTAKSLGKAGLALLKEENLIKIEQEIQTRRINGRLVEPIRKKAGLQLTSAITHPEEMVVGRLLKKVPILGTLAGKPLERAQMAFINSARAELFDYGVRHGWTEAENKLRAQFINTVTGRGNIKQVPELLSAIMTSPRYEISRWETLAAPLKNFGRLGGDLVTGKGVNRAALMNIKDMGVTAASVYGLFKAAELAGYSVDWDPRSGDFMKMRRGNEVWDISAGMAPRIRDVLRGYVAVTDPKYNQNLGEVLRGTVVRTISPSVRFPVAQGSQMYQESQGKTVGASKTKNAVIDPLSGYPVGEYDEGFQTALPLIIQSVRQALEQEGPGAAVSAGVKEFVGGSVNRYAPPKKRKGE